MWNSGHILFERFLPASKTQEGLHATHISLTIVSGQYVCRENYSASPLVEVEVSLFLTKKFSWPLTQPLLPPISQCGNLEIFCHFYILDFAHFMDHCDDFIDS